VFDLLGEWFGSDGFNGCPFINAEAESTATSPAHAVNLRHRTWIRALFTSVAAEAGVTDPEPLGFQLAMLYDGTQTESLRPWASQARDAAASLFRLPARQ